MSRLFTPAKVPYLLLGLAALVADQWSKWLVETRLPAIEPLRVIPGLLNFVYVKNTGVAFGLFPARGDVWGTVILTLLGLAALGVVGYYFARTPAGDRWLLAALGLILGGAVGNLADRIASAGVTDFIDVYFGSYHWHTFNVADSAITIGILLMAIDIFRGRGPGAEKEEAEAAAERPPASPESAA